MTTHVPSAALIYDGQCPVCRKAAEWVRGCMVPNSLELLACQSPERRSRFPEVSEARCLEAMQLVLPGGEVVSGAAALPHVLRRLRGWRRLAWCLELPGIRHASPVVYRWVARHRYTLSVIATPKGSRAGPACDADNPKDCEQPFHESK